MAKKTILVFFVTFFRRKIKIKINQKEQLEAGHHGVPLSVYKDKFFFGQDRFDDLVNELKKDGIQTVAIMSNDSKNYRYMARCCNMAKRTT